MTHFDFKTLLPALLQVEDRVSMAHGVESRVPLLDHPLVELAATIPADIKFKGGQLKHVMKSAFAAVLPDRHHSAHRQDGVSHAAQSSSVRGDGKSFVRDVFRSSRGAVRGCHQQRRDPAHARGGTAIRAQALGPAVAGVVAAGSFTIASASYKRLLTDADRDHSRR